MIGFTCESSDTRLERERGDSTLRGELGARGFMVVVVSGPFAARGAKGKEEYP
jgi:hypothetical protein